jgi:hypothetical protein
MNHQEYRYTEYQTIQEENAMEKALQFLLVHIFSDKIQLNIMTGIVFLLKGIIIK